MKKSITLMEVLVGAIILSTAFAGLLSSFVAVRHYVNRADKRLMAMNLARSSFSGLYELVRADDWDSNAAIVPNATITTFDHNIGANRFEVKYNVSSVTGMDYRKVTTEVTYPE